MNTLIVLSNVLLQFIDPAQWFFEVFLKFVIEVILYALFGLLGIFALMCVVMFCIFAYAFVYKFIDYGTGESKTVTAQITYRSHFFGAFSGSQYWLIEVVIPALNNLKGKLYVSRSTYDKHIGKKEIELHYALGSLSNKPIVPGLKS